MQANDRSKYVCFFQMSFEPHTLYLSEQHTVIVLFYTYMFSRTFDAMNIIVWGEYASKYKLNKLIGNR